MTKRSRGRPRADTESVSPAKILSEALALLDSEGFESVTMRAVAVRANVSPMTIYHHFHNRDGLIRALADTVYADVTSPIDGTVRSRIEGLLRAYRSKVVRHPGLTLAIFNRPALFPQHARRITDNLANLLCDLGLSPSRALVWVHILVDYTHGAALAVAIDGTSGSAPQADIDPEYGNYERAVSELLARLDE
ncbi:TetR/AcrR family transcriptional regulator [Pseudaminobacter soli (ex Li et al. 2025)]|uniref:TetR/AcrR family transcriptional regulator n=1 Tax=Pseudaminobacter soli (ex Li et al. 2025) TaxID=1295366 RepID=A0A2P7S533_9HYPH|nr:TetR/AcrR family transcriptional regulator [Mesorhizobium soli]PSJ57584.1 TetR/AcrR family transcriptional regulator [Mesorhizobium soli]